MTPAELKRNLTRYLENFERLTLENYALRVVIQAAQPRPAEPPLERQVSDLIRDAQEHIHERFAPLYEQLDAAAQEAELLELLAQYPQEGPVN